MSRCAAGLRALREAFDLIPTRMNSPRAIHLLLAIGLQESRLTFRDQLESRDGRDLVDGPAMGLWQFERGGGVKGVLNHPATGRYAAKLCEYRGVAPTTAAVWKALERDDVLAAGFARLLLYTLPQALPGPNEADEGWQQYLEAWRPGRPHADTWAGFYAEAREFLQANR